MTRPRLQGGFAAVDGAPLQNLVEGFILLD